MDFLGPFSYQIHSPSALKNTFPFEKNSDFSSEVNVTISMAHAPPFSLRNLVKCPRKKLYNSRKPPIFRLLNLWPLLYLA